MNAGVPKSHQNRRIFNPSSQPKTIIMKTGFSSVRGFQPRKILRHKTKATTASTAALSPSDGNISGSSC